MDIPRIDASEIGEAMRRGERVVFVDTRSPKAFEEATEQIPGSVRMKADDVDQRGAELPAGPITVAYCT
jgi:rhodanese-related sulfurtransferase